MQSVREVRDCLARLASANPLLLRFSLPQLTECETLLRTAAFDQDCLNLQPAMWACNQFAKADEHLQQSLVLIAQAQLREARRSVKQAYLCLSHYYGE